MAGIGVRHRFRAKGAEEIAGFAVQIELYMGIHKQWHTEEQ
jgi:mannose-6-phosphate isomerase-like protein (cupin superfamily)